MKSWLGQLRFTTPAQVSRPERIQVILWLAAMLGALVLMIYNFPKYQVGVHFDDAIYIILSKSLLVAEKYGLINYPGDPLEWRYPFGFPLLLTPLVAVFPNTPEAYKVLSILATLINASLLFWGWRWLSFSLSMWWGLAVSTLYLFSPQTIDLSGRVMSEPVFLTFYLLTMIGLALGFAQSKPMDGFRLSKVAPSMSQAPQKPTLFRNLLNYLWPVGLGVALAMVLFTRTIGIVFVGTAILYGLLILGKKSAIPLLGILVGFMIICGPVLLLTPVQKSDLLPNRYLGDRQAALVLSFFSTILGNPEVGNNGGPSTLTPEQMIDDDAQSLFEDYILQGFTQHFGINLRAGILPLDGRGRELTLASKLGLPFLPITIGYMVSAIVIYGYIRWIKREGLNFFIISSILYFLALFAWKWNDPRFLNPIQAQLFVALLLGIQGLLALLAKAMVRLRIFNPNTTHNHLLRNTSTTSFVNYSLVGIVGILLALSIFKSVTASDSRLHVGVIAERTAYIRQNTPTDALVLSEYPTLDFLYSGRKTLDLPDPGLTMQQLDEYFHRNQVDYILVAPRVSWMKPGYQAQYSNTMLSFIPLLERMAENDLIELIYRTQELAGIGEVMVFRIP